MVSGPALIRAVTCLDMQVRPRWAVGEYAAAWALHTVALVAAAVALTGALSLATVTTPAWVVYLAVAVTVGCTAAGVWRGLVARRRVRARLDEARAARRDRYHAAMDTLFQVPLGSPRFVDVPEGVTVQEMMDAVSLCVRARILPVEPAGWVMLPAQAATPDTTTWRTELIGETCPGGCG